VSDVAVVARVSVTPSPQLTVSDVTAVALLTVKVMETVCPTRVGLGDRVLIVTTGPIPLLMLTGKAALVLAA
jgi:hypothetical protein